MINDGWTGPRDGPFRGEHLKTCAVHGGWWTPSRPCPACVLQRRVDQRESQVCTTCEANVSGKCEVLGGELCETMNFCGRWIRAKIV